MKGLPASSRFLDDTRDLFVQLDPFLRNFNPFLEYLGMYKREIAAMLANDTAVTQATDQIGEDRVHYLRLTSPVNPEALATYPSARAGTAATPTTSRAPTTRSAGGLHGLRPRPVLHERLPDARPGHGHMPEELRNRILLYVLNSGNTVAPPCSKQSPFTFGGRRPRITRRSARRRGPRP